MNGLITLLGSKKGVVTIITIIAQVLIGLFSDQVDPETLLTTLAATGAGHAIGQGIADKNKTVPTISYTDSEGGKF